MPPFRHAMPAGLAHYPLSPPLLSRGKKTLLCRSDLQASARDSGGRLPRGWFADVVFQAAGNK